MVELCLDPFSFLLILVHLLRLIFINFLVALDHWVLANFKKSTTFEKVIFFNSMVINMLSILAFICKIMYWFVNIHWVLIYLHRAHNNIKQDAYVLKSVFA